MAKKTFLAKSRLCKGARWYIDYTVIEVTTGQEFRIRKEFDLNEIDDLNVRQLVAERLCKCLEDFIGIGLHAKAEKAANKEIGAANTKDTLLNAVSKAQVVKMDNPRDNSIKSYKSIPKIFMEWVKDRNYSDMPVDKFNLALAREFMASIKDKSKSNKKKLAPRTRNNYVAVMKTIWTEIIGDDDTMGNPWKKIQPAKPGEKTRRPFTDEERRIVAAHIQQTDYWLFRALLMQYYCYLRPVEICRLKFKSFDFKTGRILVESYEAKNWKRSWVTIPSIILPFFTDGIFDAFPVNYYIFGHDMLPGKLPTSVNTMYKRHKKILTKMHRDGLLKDISGLQWYSWKYTGISNHTHKVAPMAAKDQARHQSLDMTMIYYRDRAVNIEYKELNDDIFR